MKTDKNTREALVATLIMFAAILFLVLRPLLAEAEEVEQSNELELRAYRGGDSSGKLYLEKSVTEKLSVNVVAFKTRGWTEVVPGVVYYVTPEMSVSLGVGGSRYTASNEVKKSTHRTTTGLWYWKTTSIEAEATVERYARDPKPWYYSLYAQTPIAGKFSAGVFGEKGVGWGPRLSWLARKNVSFWFTPIVHKDRDSDISMVAGVQIAF